MARYFLRFRHSDTGLTPTFTFFKKASDTTNVTPQPSVTELGSGTYYFDYTPTFDIVFEADGGASIPTEEVRYISDTISPKDTYVDEPTSQVKDDVWNDAVDRSTGSKGDFVEHIGINTDAVNAATVFGQVYKARDVVMGGTGFGGTGVDVKTVKDTIGVPATDTAASVTAIGRSLLARDQVMGGTGFGGTGVDVKTVNDNLSSDMTSINNSFTDIKGSGFNTATDSLKIVSDNVDAINIETDAASIAAAVWDSSTASHVTAGTFGKLEQDTKTAVDAINIETDAASIADAVWDASTTGNVGAGTMGGLVNDAAANTGGLSGIANAVWDAATSAHTVAGSFGQTLQLEDSGLAQGGAAGTVTLKAGASSVTDFYKNGLITITSGTGVGQSRSITAYDGTTKIATVDRNWGTNPIAGDGYAILPAAPSSSLTNSGIAAAVWDEPAASHVTAGSFGQALQNEDSGLVQGGAATTVTLRAGASAVTDFYKNGLVEVTSGTGAKQSRSITAYDGTTKIATVDRAWGTNPIAGDGYIIHPAAPSSSLTEAGIAGAVWNEAISTHAIDGTFGQTLQLLNYGQATAGASTTITLAAGASAVSSFYNNALLVITDGTGVGQARTITAYNGGTKQATVDRAWGTNPNGTSKYMIVPTSQAPLDTASIADAVWDENLAGHAIVGSTGAKLSAGGGTIKFFANGDSDNPFIVQVSSPKHTQVKITFSEPVVMTNATNGALNLSNYSIPGLTLISVASLTAQQVMLTTSPQTPDFLYSLSVINVEDLSGNPIL